MNIYEAIQKLNETPIDRKKDVKYRGYSNAEVLALIALHPFLEVIGGRIAILMDMAIDKGMSLSADNTDIDEAIRILNEHKNKKEASHD